MISKALILLMVLISFLFADDYRTIQRNTSITTNNGESHKVGDFGNYYALLIYVEDYKHLNNLTTPKKDVEAIAKILKNRYGFLESKIIPNPKNSDELLDILDDFRNKLNKNDNLLIYYAGHGSKGGYWQLSNAKKNKRVGWISIKEAINKTLKKMRSQHILVIADSCYSGELTRSGVDENMLDPEDKEYYSKLYEIKSRNVLTSGGFEPVLDKDPTNSNHSVFANGLLEMLKSNNRLIFSLEEKYKSVEEYVEKSTNKKQTPLYSHVQGTGYEKGGDFIFLDKKSIFQKRENEKNKLYSLTIKRTPSEATVQILNIKPIYKDGIMLKRGRYKIFVFAEGYKDKKFFVELKDNLTYNVELEKMLKVKEKNISVLNDIDSTSTEDKELVRKHGVFEKFWENTGWIRMLISMFFLWLSIIAVTTEASTKTEKINFIFVAIWSILLGLIILLWNTEIIPIHYLVFSCILFSFLFAIITSEDN